jgi:S1-C subfamily serine protease
MFQDDYEPMSAKSTFLLLALVFAVIAGLIYASTTIQAKPGYVFTYAGAANSTVVLSNDEGGGTGFVVGPNLILTAKHVVLDEATGKFRTDLKATDTHGDSYDTVVVWASEDKDLALVRAALPADMVPLPISCTAPNVGDRVISLGHPLLAIKWGFAFGYISSAFPVDGLVALDITILPGDSGGPVFNAQGQVIGINDAILTWGTNRMLSAGATGYALMVPITNLCKIIPHVEA